jgi:hypothetical protein
MNATVSRYLGAIDRKDAEGIRDALAPDVRMVGMAADVFYLLEGADAGCSGPRQGTPELAAAYAGAAR